MEKVLEVKNIEKYYGNKSNLTKAIDNISFTVEKGEFVGIMGASGSGKSTLLNVISTIDRVTAGHIIVNGEDITKLKGNKLGYRKDHRIVQARCLPVMFPAITMDGWLSGTRGQIRIPKKEKQMITVQDRTAYSLCCPYGNS